NDPNVITSVNLTSIGSDILIFKLLEIPGNSLKIDATQFKGIINHEGQDVATFSAASVPVIPSDCILKAAIALIKVTLPSPVAHVQLGHRSRLFFKGMVELTVSVGDKKIPVIGIQFSSSATLAGLNNFASGIQYVAIKEKKTSKDKFINFYTASYSNPSQLSIRTSDVLLPAMDIQEYQQRSKKHQPF
ncbi:hypothetical protein BGX33_002334, partial [Mortierella sp. NVP41]